MNKILDRLMVDLSLRENNTHAGSSLGGNPSEFFFLLTHNIAVVHPTSRAGISFRERDGVILILCPVNVTMRQLRAEFSIFYNQHADKRDMTFDQLSNVSFLKDMRNPSLNIRLLMKCLSSTTRLMSSLKDKEVVNGAIERYFINERARLRKDLETHLGWTEPNYPEMDPTYEAMLNSDEFTEDQMVEHDTFRAPDRPERDIFHFVLESFPAFKARNEDIEKRKEAALGTIYSSEDDKLIYEIIYFPRSIAMFCIRKLIGIDMIIKLNLDTKLKSLRSIEDDNG